MSMHTFQDLVDSRKAWIADVLRPWCRSASLVELRKAADEWGDIAGRVDPEFSLWLWAWSRFPVLYVEGLRGLEESFEVEVTLQDGRRLRGFPDARRSRSGQLVVQTAAGTDGPVPIDAVTGVARCERGRTDSQDRILRAVQ